MDMDAIGEVVREGDCLEDSNEAPSRVQLRLCLVLDKGVDKVCHCVYFFAELKLGQYFIPDPNFGEIGRGHR